MSTYNDLSGNGIGSSVGDPKTATEDNVNIGGSGGNSNSIATPLFVGDTGKYNTTPPVLTDGQRSDVQLNPVGALKVALTNTAGAELNSSPPADGGSTAATSLAVKSYGIVWDGTTNNRQRGDTAGTYVVANPTANAANALARVATTVVASSLVVKASPGNLYGYNIVTGASAGYLMFFDATTAPADGTVTPKLVLPIAANTGIQTDRDIPIAFTTGIVMIFSTTGPFTKTASATAFLAGDAK